LGFCSVYETLPYITASFGGLSSFDGLGHLFDSFPTVLWKTRSIAFAFYFLVNFISPSPTLKKKKRKRKRNEK
jgi:hypothetical protein